MTRRENDRIPDDIAAMDVDGLRNEARRLRDASDRHRAALLAHLAICPAIGTGGQEDQRGGVTREGDP